MRGHDDLDDDQGLDDVQRHALLQLRTGPSASAREVARVLGVRAGVARTALEGLVATGAATVRDTGGDRRYEAHAPRARTRPSTTPRSRPEGAGTSIRNDPAILTALENGPASLPDLAERTGLTTAQLHYALRDLRRRGLVALDGGRGQRESTYRSLHTT